MEITCHGTILTRNDVTNQSLWENVWNVTKKKREIWTNLERRDSTVSSEDANISFLAHDCNYRDHVLFTVPKKANKSNTTGHIGHLWRLCWLQTAALSKVYMCAKCGTSCSQYLLISHLLLEVEWKVMVLLQANKAAKQTPTDIKTGCIAGKSDHLCLSKFVGLRLG